jgi:hypothetical protein
MPMGRNDERRTNNDERTPMTDVLENLSYLTPTSVMESLDSTSYPIHILTPLFAMQGIYRGAPNRICTASRRPMPAGMQAGVS